MIPPWHTLKKLSLIKNLFALVQTRRLTTLLAPSHLALERVHKPPLMNARM